MSEQPASIQKSGDILGIKYIWWIIAAILGIGVFVLIYFSGKAAGKRNGTINLSSAVNDTGGGPQASTDEIRKLAERLHNDLSGVNSFGHDLEPYQELLTMSDSDFVRVYNEFDHEFQKDSGQTFRQWLESEQTWIQIGSKWPPLRDAIVTRMAKLKLL